MKELDKIVDVLSEEQKRYLFYRVFGMNEAEALKVTSTSKAELVSWRNTEGFQAGEREIVEHPERYYNEAGQAFAQTLGLKAMMVLDNVLTRGLKWGELHVGEMPHVMKAVALMLELKKPREQAKSGFEEKLREIKGGQGNGN